MKSLISKISIRRIIAGITTLSLLYLGLAFRAFVAVYKDQKHFYEILITASILLLAHLAIILKMDEKIETKSVTTHQVAALLFMLLFSMIGSIGLFASDPLLAVRIEFDIVNKFMIPATLIATVITGLKMSEVEK